MWSLSPKARPGQRVGSMRRAGGTVIATFAGIGLAAVFIVSSLESLKNITGQVITQGGGGVQGRESLGLALNLAISMLAALMIEGGARQWTGQAEWDLEWLVTLPVPLGPLLAGRIIDRSITNLLGLLTLAPPLGWLVWHVHGSPWAPLIAAALAFPLCVLIGATQTLIDTGLRLRLPAPQLRNLQALMSVTGMVGIYVGVSASAASPALAQRLVDLAPVALAWTPPGLAVAAVATPSPHFAAACVGLLLLQTAAYVLTAFAVLMRWLRQGVASGGARESGGRLAATRPLPSARDWLGPVARREVRLLSRDRNYLVQTLVVPVVILAAQIFLRNTRTGSAASLGPELMASVAFGVAAHALMFSAFQTLIHEGQALWLLYCVPRDLEQVLLRKAAFWCAVVSLFPAALLGYTALTATRTWAFVGLSLFAAVGVPIYAALAGAMGVLGSNPLEESPRRRLKVGIMYQYLVLAGVYIYAIQTDSHWRRLTLWVLMVAVAVALWQKARDRLPFLLDPVAGPPAQVSLADGLVAALMFLVLQDGALYFLAYRSGHVADQRALLLSFVFAGGCVWSGLRWIYHRAKSAGVPLLWRPGRSLHAAVWGLAVGGLAGLVGNLYLQIMLHNSVWGDAVQTAMDTTQVTGWVMAMAILAAPVFEEFIFRGLIFGGLRRSLPTWQAGAVSAWVFAMAHTPLSAAPVWVLGFGCAMAYARTGALLAPMLAHGVYNALMLLAQWSF